MVLTVTRWVRFMADKYLYFNAYIALIPQIMIYQKNVNQNIKVKYSTKATYKI